MTTDDSTRDTAGIERDLHGLATAPPVDLADRILAEVGLAERVATVGGPLGPLRVRFNDSGVTACVPAAAWDDHLARNPGLRIAEVEALPPRLATGVARVLRSGKLGSLPIDLSGLSEFQQAVLRKTAEIPPGEIRPYGWVAREIGKPGSVRAVGSALNRNPIPILIPCHRVSRSDGHIGQYAFGPEMKRQLLDHEGLDPVEVESLADRGVRYLGSDTTNIFCHPSCHAARRITDRHRVEFRTEQTATGAGYRPCKLCRPGSASVAA